MRPMAYPTAAAGEHRYMNSSAGISKRRARHKSAKKSAEPGKPKPADEHRWIGNQLAGTLQNMIETCVHQANGSSHTDDEKSLVMMARLAFTFQIAALHELRAATVKICLQDISSNQQTCGDHEAKRGNRERPKMQKRNHRWIESGSPVSIHNGAFSLECRSHSKAHVALVVAEALQLIWHATSGHAGRSRDRSRRRMRSIPRARSARGMRAELSSGKAARKRQSPARSRSALILAFPRSRRRGMPRTILRPTPSNPLL